MSTFVNLLTSNDRSKSVACVVSEDALELQAQLSKSFNTPMQIWRRIDGLWRLANPESNENDDASPINNARYESTQLRAWIDQVVMSDAGRPQTLQFEEGEIYVAVVCYADDGTPEVVGGNVSPDLKQMVEQTAELALMQSQASGQRLLLEDYAHRLSSGYEEMAFLRHLSQQMKVCVATRTLAEATSEILPQLCELMEVEAVALIAPQPVLNVHFSFVQPENSLAQLGFIECTYGKLDVSTNSLFQAIRTLPQFESRTSVRNYAPASGGELTRDLNLRSLVITPIRSDNVLYGWLVGINKRIDPAQPAAPDVIGHNELGSMEATLLESAAIMLSSHASNNRLYKEMEVFMIQAIQTLVGVIEAKDKYTLGHSERVASIARRLGAEMGLTSQECQDIYLAGLLHDIGKVGVPDDVLLKAGKLTDEEFAKIKLHPEIGAKLIHGLKPLAKLVPGVLHHHEAFDGTGYPHRLAGESIPLMARILAVADAFDAMTSCRPYRTGMSIEVAENIICAGRDKQWDSRVIDAFIACRADISKIVNRPAQGNMLKS